MKERIGEILALRMQRRDPIRDLAAERVDTHEEEILARDGVVSSLPDDAYVDLVDQGIEQRHGLEDVP